MLPLTEPRNPKSRCATCEYLALTSEEHMHCVMRDLYICRGYRKCKDYLCNPDKIPYKNGDYIIYESPTSANAFATQKGIIREIKSKKHHPGVILIEMLPRRSNIGYLDTRFWTGIIRKLTEKEIKEITHP